MDRMRVARLVWLLNGRDSLRYQPMFLDSIDAHVHDDGNYSKGMARQESQWQDQLLYKELYQLINDIEMDLKPELDAIDRGNGWSCSELISDESLTPEEVEYAKKLAQEEDGA